MSVQERTTASYCLELSYLLKSASNVETAFKFHSFSICHDLNFKGQKECYRSKLLAKRKDVTRVCQSLKTKSWVTEHMGSRHSERVSVCRPREGIGMNIKRLL